MKFRGLNPVHPFHPVILSNYDSTLLRFISMKYAIIIPDGGADEPQESLGGKHAAPGGQHAGDGCDRRGGRRRARVPHAEVAAGGSDVANMSLLGYDPLENFTGRAPLEAAAQGIELGADDWAIRCNLVTVEDQVMRDFTADHIIDRRGREAAGHDAGTPRRIRCMGRRCSSCPA